MAIPRRTQAVPLTQSVDRPSLLADLPHVGAKSDSGREHHTSPAATVLSDQPAVSTHPAFAEFIPMDRVGRRTAAPTTAEKHFLDNAHVAVKHQEYLDEPESALDHPVHQMGHPQTQRRGWRKFCSQAHTHLAPFAGLIVTLALLTSAGLLFWLISRGQPANLDLRQFEINEGALSVQLSESEPSASAIPKAKTPEATDQAQEPTNATQATVPAEKTNEPIAEEHSDAPPSDATASTPLGEISFPATSTPFAFDYSKVFDRAPTEPSDEIHGLPEVAEREDSSAENPVAR